LLDVWLPIERSSNRAQLRYSLSGWPGIKS
jgi:hypothetical protein